MVYSNLTIRPFKTEDLSNIHAYASDEDTTKYMLWGPNTLEDTQDFLNYVLSCYQKNPITHYEYGVEFEGKIIGGIALIVDYENLKAEIGWIIHKDYQRRGLMYQAALQMIEFAKTLKIKTIYATADSRNVASYKLMEKLGMHHVRNDYQVRFNKVTQQKDLDQVYYEMEI
ncbi:GNAT family N-acetyltransferase [Acholeplasma vituli]|uniref:GNAT family N-acetyltransferase n=1 Tax=Paracholeplasma vituli TaxID=69473 RepID=A0ABT2PUI3_9MOLU|nr:GNAT family N-acetyltransferase [Paracholeplasma vituli]MCU0104605.1 GNAT family N-acetyltransferase [Paracholeplasma vituli]